MINILSKSAYSDALSPIVGLSFILDLAKVKYTYFNLSRLLEDNPHPISLLSFHDILKEYNISSGTIRRGNHDLEDIQTPFICAVEDESSEGVRYVLIAAVNKDEVTYLDARKNSLLKMDRKVFDAGDKGYALLVDLDEAQDERNYDQHKSTEQIARTRVNLQNFAALILLCSIGAIPLVMPLHASISASLFLLTSFLGTLFSVLLVWSESSAGDSALFKQLCGMSEHTDCNRILKSEGSKFLGVSWSVWGVTYFATFFISQVVAFGFFISFWSLISLVISPYIFYSLYYQRRVVKKWCPLCLAVQVVILANALLSIFHFQNVAFATAISLQALLPTIVLSAIIFVMTSLATKYMANERQSRAIDKRYKELHYDSDVFRTMLNKGLPMHRPADGLGVLIGSPTATTEIVKVCSPYCGPCSKAHTELEKILKNNPHVRLRIIFTANGNTDDKKTAPVSHIMALNEQYTADEAHAALDDWYSASEKDYTQFASRYPLDSEYIAAQKVKLQDMRTWCEDMQIRFTPTIFVNGYLLPDGYRIKDLNYVI